jgi:hypothetical protein
MKASQTKLAYEVRVAKSLWGNLAISELKRLGDLIHRYKLSVTDGDLRYLNSSWYVTHAGLLRLAERRHCAGIHVRPVLRSCDIANSRWVFIVFKSKICKGFVGYGDAEPSNTSGLVRGAELRVAETRAVNRALRKAYGIGICSFEELGSSFKFGANEPPKFPARSVDWNGNGHRPKPRVRDRLCQIIRKHNLDAELVKSYAVSFCGTKTLREATREQVEAFVIHLADWAEKDRNALLCQLNSFQRSQAGAA